MWGELEAVEVEDVAADQVGLDSDGELVLLVEARDRRG